MHWLKHNLVLMINLFLVSISCITPNTFADTLTSVQNQPPTLATAPLISATPEMLKRGLWGSASFEIGIDSTGSIDSCSVIPSGNVAFDSLVKCKVTAANFTPAFENGSAVSSIIKSEIAIHHDSLLTQCLRLPPNFVGTVIDTSLKINLQNTRVLMYYPDTTEDSCITIGFNHYLSLIGNCTGQKFNGRLITTTTDSFGNFSFRLLPAGHFTVSVQSPGYEIGQFRGHITGNEPLQRQYILKSIDNSYLDSTANKDEITVYGKPAFTEKKIMVAEEEKRTGFSSMLSNVVQAKAEIRRVPEGPSMMLVRSGCPYDNVYVIAGVPMLAPFHFGGHPYADIDGVMISALPSVKVTINDIAAKRIDASGCIVETEPGKIKYDNHNAGKGLYLKGDFCMLGVDLLAAYSSKEKPDDFVQIGYSVSNNYSLKWHNFFPSSFNIGNHAIGTPLNYGNATISGSKSVGKLQTTAFGWLAWDSYNVLKSTTMNTRQIRGSLTNSGPTEKVLFPWGMGSIKFNADSSNRSVTIGGAHQFFGAGKQIGSTISTSRSFLNNGELTVNLDTLISRPIVAKLTARISLDQWGGFFSRETNDHTDTLRFSNGTETGVHINTSLTKQKGRITTGLDLLTSVINYNGKKNQFIGDAGTNVTYESEYYQAGIHFGRISSRPDIRGLPDSLFRMQLNHTYVASLPLFFRYGMITRFGVEPYTRYSTNAAQLDPVHKAWDPNRSTPVLAIGTDFDVRIVPSSWAELSTALNLANTRRHSPTNDSLAYEWNLPWTIRTSLHLNSKNERFHIYIDYIRTKGLPYYDPYNQAYEALPVYRSIDLNFQVCTPIPRQMFLNKLDCFVTFKNLQDILRASNVRDYYWNNYGQRQPIYLGLGRVDIGARFGIKL